MKYLFAGWRDLTFTRSDWSVMLPFDVYYVLGHLCFTFHSDSSLKEINCMNPYFGYTSTISLIGVVRSCATISALHFLCFLWIISERQKLKVYLNLLKGKCTLWYYVLYVWNTSLLTSCNEIYCWTCYLFSKRVSHLFVL